MLRHIQAECLTCQTPWLARPTAGKFQAQASGLVSIIPPSTAMLIPCRTASTLPRLHLRPPRSTRSLENSCCLTTRFAPARIRTLRCWPSCKVRTRPPPILLIGSDLALNERKASSGGFPKTSRDREGWASLLAPAFMYWILVHVTGVPPRAAAAGRT